MVKVFQGTDEEYYMDGYLKSNLDTAKEVIKKDWDFLFIVDGSEGAGKSIVAMCMAKYCDPSLTLDRITFTPNTFRKAIVEAKQYQAVIFDEAYTGLSSRATMSMINRILIKMLAEIRQKNLFVWVVMPCVFDLDKYVALWRSRALVHVYTGENFERGYFAFYNVNRKKDLYINGKRFYSYAKPKPNFVGRFTNHYVVDEKEYRDKKKNSLIAREKATEELEIRREVEDNMFERVMGLPDDIKHSVRIKMLGMPESTYWVKLRRWKEEKGLI